MDSSFISRKKSLFFWTAFIFLNSIFLSSLIQVSDGNTWDSAKHAVSNNVIYTDFKNEFQHLVSQIINRTTSEGVELVGNVTYVVDGDTLDINGIRVRLSLVDTPERGQLGFKDAKEFVSSLCLGKKGELDVDDGQRRGDRYGREIGVVYCNGINLNAKLMKEQLARILTEYCEVSEFSKENWTRIACDVTMHANQ